MHSIRRITCNRASWTCSLLNFPLKFKVQASFRHEITGCGAQHQCHNLLWWQIRGKRYGCGQNTFDSRCSIFYICFMTAFTLVYHLIPIFHHIIDTGGHMHNSSFIKVTAVKQYVGSAVKTDISRPKDIH